MMLHGGGDMQTTNTAVVVQEAGLRLLKTFPLQSGCVQWGHSATCQRGIWQCWEKLILVGMLLYV